MDEGDLRRTGVGLDDEAALELLRSSGPRPPVPAERAARVHAAVSERWRRAQTARRWRRRAAVVGTLAAAAVLAVALGLRVVLAPSPDATVGTVEAVRGTVRCADGSCAHELTVGVPVVTGSTIESGSPGLLALRLSGGASVRLDSDSTVILDGPRRLRLERGRVYIDTGPDPSMERIAVVTEVAEVRDVGTQFEVRSLGGRLRVRVREGEVLVQRPLGTSTCVAGHQVIVGRTGPPEIEPLDPFDPEWRWVLDAAPPFPIEGRSAAEFLRWVARESGLRLRWAEQDLADAAETTLLHGDISAMRPDEAPRAVLPACGLQLSREGATLVVRAIPR